MLVFRHSRAHEDVAKRGRGAGGASARSRTSAARGSCRRGTVRARARHRAYGHTRGDRIPRAGDRLTSPYPMPYPRTARRRGESRGTATRARATARTRQNRTSGPPATTDIAADIEKPKPRAISF